MAYFGVFCGAKFNIMTTTKICEITRSMHMKGDVSNSKNQYRCINSLYATY